MKHLLFLLVTILSIEVNAQESDTLYMSRLEDTEWSRDFSNQKQFQFIKFTDGSVLGIGDKMIFGNASGTNQSTSTQTGLFSSSTTRNNTYSYIMVGRMAAAMMSGVVLLPDGWKGRDAEIENIKLYKSKKEGKPSVASIIFQNKGADFTVLDLKFAMQYGEVINPKAAMTSDQALAELKKAKDKLDLGLISQKDFDSLKTILAPIINKL
jgi:hypothetical protein